MPLDVTRLLLTTDAVGGVWRYSIDLARGLSDRGIGIVLAVLGPPAGAGHRAEAATVPGLTLVQTGLPLDWTAAGPGELSHASERLAALAGLAGASAIHLHAPALLGPAAWPAPVVVVAHSCLGTWWRAVRGGAPPPDFAWRIAATRDGLRAAAAVIAPSASHADALRAVYGPLDTHVVHNGAAPAAPAPAPAPVLGHRRGIVTAGRLWDEGKGLAAIDRAANRLQTPIRAAGPTEGPNGARIALPNLDLLGTLDPAGMAHAYAAASVFVSMARYEPFGLSVLEAANAGLRLVLSDIPTFRELWHGAATFTSDEDLPHALQRALDQPGNDGAQARAARYTLDAMVEATLAIHGSAGTLCPWNASAGEGLPPARKPAPFEARPR